MLTKAKSILKSRRAEGYIDVCSLVLGSETSRREQALREKTGLQPTVTWSNPGRIQLNEEVTVTVTYQTNIGLFSGFGSFPITLRSDAAGKSEVYWK